MTGLAGRSAPWRPVPDDRTPAPPRLLPAGPWQQDGQVLHGIFRVRAGRGEQTLAVWHGWRQWQWTGLVMPTVTSPLLSAWNHVLAQGLTWRPWMPSPRVDPGEWTARALLDGRRAYGAFGATRDGARAFAADAEARGLAVLVDGPRLGRHVTVHAARTERFADLFDLDEIATAYALGLGPAAARHIGALSAFAEHSPARHLGRLGELAESAPAVVGLALGEPPALTAARLAHPPRRHRPRAAAQSVLATAVPQ